jgi:homeobox domain-containing protein
MVSGSGNSTNEILETIDPSLLNTVTTNLVQSNLLLQNEEQGVQHDVQELYRTWSMDEHFSSPNTENPTKREMEDSLILPRKMKRRKKISARTIFTDEDRSILEAQFALKPYLEPDDIGLLQEKLNRRNEVTPDAISNWFRNKRARCPPSSESQRKLDLLNLD